jgi:hypothetical protein
MALSRSNSCRSNSIALLLQSLDAFCLVVVEAVVVLVEVHAFVTECHCDMRAFHTNIIIHHYCKGRVQQSGARSTMAKTEYSPPPTGWAKYRLAELDDSFFGPHTKWMPAWVILLHDAVLDETYSSADHHQPVPCSPVVGLPRGCSEKMLIRQFPYNHPAAPVFVLFGGRLQRRPAAGNKTGMLPVPPVHRGHRIESCLDWLTIEFGRFCWTR